MKFSISQSINGCESLSKNIIIVASDDHFRDSLDQSKSRKIRCHLPIYNNIYSVIYFIQNNKEFVKNFLMVPVCLEHPVYLSISIVNKNNLWF